jgi:hypothetical protein
MNLMDAFNKSLNSIYCTFGQNISLYSNSLCTFVESRSLCRQNESIWPAQLAFDYIIMRTEWVPKEQG